MGRQFVVRMVRFLLGFMFTITLFNCKEASNSSPSPTASTSRDSIIVKKSGDSKSAPIKTLSVQPMVQYYSKGATYNCPQEQWRTDHYCANSGRLILFNPGGFASSTSAWSTMRNHYGFNSIICLDPSYIDAATSVGFNFKNLICGVPPDLGSLSGAVQTAANKGVHNFYYDEPCTHNGNGNGINYSLQSAYGIVHPNAGVLWTAEVCPTGLCSSGNYAISNCVSTMLSYSDHIACDDYYATGPGRSCSGCDINIVPRSLVKSQSLCKIIRGHAASLYDRNSVSLS